MRHASTFLVTGGAGFLGSHLCDRLLQAGYRVVAVDNLSSGSRENLAHLNEHPRFELKVQDVALPVPVNADGIFNLASPASPPQYQRDPIGTTLTNVLGTWRMLKLADACRVPLVQASTSEVYGDPGVHPQPESYHGDVSTVGPRACYDEGKRCAETLCFDYLRQRGVPIRVARIFNTYGPRMQPGDGRVVSNFIVQALQGQDITLYGDGRQTRCFCYVDDMVDGLMHLMRHDEAGPINLGNPHEISMLELAERVLKLTGSRSRLVFKPLPQDDPRRRCPDITLARQALGWQPSVSLDEGLSRTIEFFKQKLGLKITPQAQPRFKAAVAASN